MILEKLWLGEIYPSEDATLQTSDFYRAKKEAVEQEKKLLELLPTEGLDLYETYTQKQAVLGGLVEKSAFVRGFRLAVRLLLDAVGGAE